MPPRASDRMFFIVGRGRSGTTLLAQMLDRHPGVCVSPEALFLVSLLGPYRRAVWDEGTVHRFVRDLWLEERMIRWRVDPARVEARLQELARSGEASFAAACAEVYAEEARFRGGDEATLLGDKNPHYALFVEQLAELYPRARFIHVVRDPRDNILSFRGVPFDLSSVAGLAVRWVRYNRRVLDVSKRLGERYLRVRFEDLTAEPAKVLSVICETLGIDPLPEMVDGAQTMQAAALPWHARLRGPVDSTQAGKWVERMDESDVLLADRLCRDTALELGYPVAESWKRARRWNPRGALGRVAGGLMTTLEELLFRLPLGLRWRVVRTYRRWTGNEIS